MYSAAPRRLPDVREKPHGGQCIADFARVAATVVRVAEAELTEAVPTPAFYRFVVQLGAGDPDHQWREAIRLEATLRSGELPAPLLLVSQQQVEPRLPKSAFTVLSGSVMVAFAGQLLLLRWLAFRSQAGTDPPGG